MFSTMLSLAPMVSLGFAAAQPIADDSQTGFNIVMIFLTLLQILMGM